MPSDRSGRVAAAIGVCAGIMVFAGAPFLAGWTHRPFGLVIAWAMLWAPAFVQGGGQVAGAQRRIVARHLGGFAAVAVMLTTLFLPVFAVGSAASPH